MSHVKINYSTMGEGEAPLNLSTDWYSTSVKRLFGLHREYARLPITEGKKTQTKPTTVCPAALK